MARTTLATLVLSCLALSACGTPDEAGSDGANEEGSGEDGTSTDGSGTGDGSGEGTGTGDGDGDGDGDGECPEGTCHPLGDDCGENELCTFANTEFTCTPDASGGDGTAGTVCNVVNECNPGLACIQSVFFSDCAGDACCSPNCDVDAPNTCPNADAGEVCVPWFENTQVDACYANAGVCGMP